MAGLVLWTVGTLLGKTAGQIDSLPISASERPEGEYGGAGRREMVGWYSGAPEANLKIERPDWQTKAA